jgi:hypothetical protein
MSTADRAFIESEEPSMTDPMPHADDADVAEQQQPIVDADYDSPDENVDEVMEADAADVVEQRREVPDDDAGRDFDR